MGRRQASRPPLNKHTAAAATHPLSHGDGEGSERIGGLSSTNSDSAFMEQTPHFIQRSPTGLPPRLFAANRYPTLGPRLNIYSKAHIIGTVAAALAGTEDMEILLASQFGQLFRLPVARCNNSAKLIHALLARQLVTNKKHELWTLFGSSPLRFSIVEFQRITGLNCGPVPNSLRPLGQEPNTISSALVSSDSMWFQLFKKQTVDITATDALRLLTTPGLPECNRLPLALIALLDGVVVCGHKNLQLTPAYVEMLSDVDCFLAYRWGREAFRSTMARFSPLPRSQSNPDPLGELRDRLKQQTSAC